MAGSWNDAYTRLREAQDQGASVEEVERLAQDEYARLTEEEG
jgi:hypothetical protein